MGKLNTVIAFFTGATVGGAAVWYITKERYAQLAEEEISSVKEAYAQRESKREKAEKAMSQYQGAEDEDAPATDGPVTPAVTAKVTEKGSISEYAQRIQNGEPPEYSKTVVPTKTGAQEKPEQSENSGDVPYVISPDEFDELDGYTAISLTYFADGVLSDENGIVIDDVEEIVGDGLNHFGEYDEDAVYVRNDAKRCDYEILKDERKYAEFRKTLPTNI